MPHDLDRNVNAELAGFAQKLKDTAEAQLQQAAAPTDINIQASQPTQTAAIQAIVAPTPAPAATPPVPASVTPAAEPAAEPAKAEPDTTSTNPLPDADEPETAWDKDLISVTQVKEEILTFESLGSALKLEKTPKSTAELVEQFTAQQQKIKELETVREQSLDDYDPDLKEVLQVAKNKGDWKAFLSTKVINYNNADPAALFQREVELDPRFKNPNTGLIDFEAVDAELAQIPQAVKIAQGNMIKQQLIAQQENRRAQVLQEADRRQVEFNRNLAEAAKRVPEFLSKDKFGISVEPKHADFLYEGIRSGKLIEKHLGKVDISGIAPEKLIKTLALAEWGENISKHQFSQGIVQGKRQLLAKAQNVQLNSPAMPPAPNVADPNKVETPKEKIQKMMNRNHAPQSL